MSAPAATLAVAEFPAWDPVFLDLPGPIDLRWYGLMYVVGFVVGNWILGRLARRGLLPVEVERVGDLLVYLVVGVLAGGRLGYALIYDHELLDPVRIVQLWRGGLAFHGGLLGTAIAAWLFARKHGVPFLRVADACALAVTPGIFAVRMANFVNGELYGRATEAGTFGAMRFPTEPAALEALGIAGLDVTRDRELAIQVAVGHREWSEVRPRLSDLDASGHAIPWDAIRARLDWASAQAAVPFRHPSQLYEGLGEGLLVGLLLLAAWLLTRRRPLGKGAYLGLFLVGYGLVRWFLELLRQPDVQFTSADDPVGIVFLGMTMGQTLCAGMILVGALLLWSGRKRVESVRTEPGSN